MKMLPILFVACAAARADIVLILDSSTSVSQVNFRKMLEFCKDLILGADIDNGNVRIGVVIYSTDVYVQFHLNEYDNRLEVADAIDNIPYKYGSTNSAGGLRTMRTDMFQFRNGDRPGVPNIAIMITDGISNVNSRRTIPEAELARREGIHIYAIGIGLTDTRELNAMATVPARDNSFNVNDFNELAGIKQQLFSAVCAGKYACIALGNATLILILLIFKVKVSMVCFVNFYCFDCWQ